MIIDKLGNAHWYYKLGGNLQTAFDWLQNTDLLALRPGRVEIDGDRVFADVHEYIIPADKVGVWEGHRLYMDLQFVVSGIERMRYTNVDLVTPNSPYNEERDSYTLEGDGDDKSFTVTDGDFALFGPQDAHMPGLPVGQGGAVKKVVVKVKVE